MLTTIQHTVDAASTRLTSRTMGSKLFGAAVVHRECRRTEVRHDVAAALAAFDEGRSAPERTLDCVADRVLRAINC